MPFYLYQGRYSTAAIKAMVEAPQDREASAKKLAEAVGGKVHSFYFAFGEHDFVAIVEVPDDHAMAALSLTVAASGGISGGVTTKLLTSKEAMNAMEAARYVADIYEPPSMLRLNLGYAL